MRNFILKIPGKIFFSLMIIFFLFFQVKGLGQDLAGQEETQEKKIKKAMKYRDIFTLISETDLNCSFFIWEEELPEMEIIGAERGEEKILIREYDIVYINKGIPDGIKKDQVYLILEIGSKIKSRPSKKKLGRLAFKRGIAKIIEVRQTKSYAKVERVCGRVTMGNFLVPYNEKKGLLGKDLGYEVPFLSGEGLEGFIAYLQRDYEQIGDGHWAIIDLGENDGIQVGQQLLIYRRMKKRTPHKSIGNVIVIDAQKKSSTVKVLSCSSVLKLGDKVRTR